MAKISELKTQLVRGDYAKIARIASCDQSTVSRMLGKVEGERNIDTEVGQRVIKALKKVAQFNRENRIAKKTPTV